MPCSASPPRLHAFVVLLGALGVLALQGARAAPASTGSAPTAASPVPAAPPAAGHGGAQHDITPLQPGEEFYDQRQNGSENYRIHMDGMVVVVAPPEALMSISNVAAGGGGQGGQLEQQLLDIVAAQQAAGVEETNDVRPGNKPGAAKPPQQPACQEGTPGCKKRRPSLPAKSRSQLRLASLLLPLLHRQQGLQQSLQQGPQR